MRRAPGGLPMEAGGLSVSGPGGTCRHGKALGGADSPTSSAGIHVPTPSRAETGKGADGGSDYRWNGAEGVRAAAAPLGRSQEGAERRRRQLEHLLGLPSRVVRVGGGFT